MADMNWITNKIETGCSKTEPAVLNPEFKSRRGIVKTDATKYPIKTIVNRMPTWKKTERCAKIPFINCCNKKITFAKDRQKLLICCLIDEYYFLGKASFTTI